MPNPPNVPPYEVRDSAQYPWAQKFPNVDRTTRPMTPPDAGVYVFAEGDFPYAMLPDGTVLPWGTGGAVVNGAVTVTVADSPYTVAATVGNVYVDTSGGAVIVNLPAAPANGRAISIKKITTDANLMTIGRNTKNIEGAAANLTTTSGLRPSFALGYSTPALGWWIN